MVLLVADTNTMLGEHMQKLTKPQITLIKKVLKAPGKVYLSPLTSREGPRHKEWYLALEMFQKGILRFESVGETDFEGPARPWRYSRAKVYPWFGNLKQLRKAVKVGTYVK